MEQLMNTINGTAARAKREGLGVSTNLIRSLVKSNTIPYIRVGNNQVIINYSVLQNFLITGNATAPEQKVAGEIRPIPEKISAVK